MPTEVLQNLAIALGLGLIVGLQRESAESQIAGVRTVPLVTLLGSMCALLVPTTGGWIVAAGLVAVAAATAMGNAARLRGGDVDPGITTEVALLLMYGLGAYTMLGGRVVAVVVAGTVAVLLHFKAELHGAVGRLDRPDLRAIMQLVLLALVVLPVLPDTDIGPFAVFNPREMWLMVVLIAGLGLAGYIALKFLGENAGIIAGGLLGGLISSTATTVSWARRTRGREDLSRAAALVILLASTVVYGRVLVEIAAVARPFLSVAAPPILALAAVTALVAAAFWVLSRGRGRAGVEGQQPADLKTAFTFAVMYVVVLFAVAYAKDRAGAQGLYLVSVLSGLTDVDAITLSVARLAGSGQIEAGQGWRLIVVALLSNLVFKGAMAAVLGDARLRRVIAVVFGVQLLAGAAVLAFWPQRGSGLAIQHFVTELPRNASMRDLTPVGP
ncbi:MAG TPA: MgtC/SapB family protein [Vicinamibacteria bacterium]|nr:MgtC/SapB family protein [Vicinamibacteria bacterium]